MKDSFSIFLKCTIKVWQPQIKDKEEKWKKNKDNYQVIPFKSLFFCHHNYFVTRACIIRLNRSVLFCLKKKRKRNLNVKDLLSEAVRLLPIFWIHSHLLAELYLVSLLVTESRQLGELGSVRKQSAFKLNKPPKDRAGSLYFDSLGSLLSKQLHNSYRAQK